ncbi:MAG: DNA translocase FtsK, partial [Atopobium sp.]|nr:DNA translocase FtsK [Atopobium sp.]
QGCWVSDEEIEETVKYIRTQRVAEYHDNILTVATPTQADGVGGVGGMAQADDPLIWEAARIIVDSQLGSTSSLQRALSVGYARAGRIMDMLEAKGVVGPANGSKPREVLIDKDALEELKVQDAAYREVE